MIKQVVKKETTVFFCKVLLPERGISMKSRNQKCLYCEICSNLWLVSLCFAFSVRYWRPYGQQEQRNKWKWWGVMAGLNYSLLMKKCDINSKCCFRDLFLYIVWADFDGALNWVCKGFIAIINLFCFVSFNHYDTSTNGSFCFCFIDNNKFSHGETIKHFTLLTVTRWLY